MRQLDEPDRGTTYYVNNGFGDVLSSTDANGRVATWEFDALGRTTSRIDKLGVQISRTIGTAIDLSVDTLSAAQPPPFAPSTFSSNHSLRRTT